MKEPDQTPTLADLSVIDEIAAERRRQVEAEGWTAEHDDRENRRGELAMAAALYATPSPLFSVSAGNGGVSWQDPWPWYHGQYSGREQCDNPPALKVLDGDKRKTHPRRKQLIVAAALIVAEIERLDRRGRAT